jgi:arylsulfatase A-like enzyme
MKLGSKPGYETWINHRVVTVAELLRDAGYHTYLSGKWHLSGANFENGTWPYNRGFEKSFTLLNGGANHFKGFPEIPVEKVRFAEDGKMITRPGNNSLYSNDMYTDKMLGFLKNSTVGKPFFAYLAFQVAHSPFQSPRATLKNMTRYTKWDGMKLENKALKMKRNWDFGLST